MPHSDDPQDTGHLPSADDVAQQKKDLWAAAKEIALARRGQTPPAPPPLAPKKRRIKLKAPAIPRHEPEGGIVEELAESPEPTLEDVPEALTTLSAAIAEPEPVSEAPKSIPRAEEKDDERSTRFVAAPATKKKKEVQEQAPATHDAKAVDTPKAKSKADLLDDQQPDEDEPKPDPDEDERAAKAKARREQLVKIWRTIGGESLSLSVGIHLFILIAATLLYVTYNREERIDFLSGGGTKQGSEASQSLENKVTRKKNQWLNKAVPMQRIAVQNAMSQITLPDQDPVLQLPMTRDFLTAGKMAGGGFGDGIGLGGKGGANFKPITLFGREIIGKKLAVVLDVSYSMTPYLQEVVKEVDRVARGSPVILYYGCGIDRPRAGAPLNERAYRTQERSFEKFWRFLRDDPSKPPGQLPNGDVYSAFARRNNTYYVDHNGTEFAWTALLNEIFRSADALYWFCDFEDPVNEKQMGIVKENLDLRKQRLYIHPQKRGFSFEMVRDTLAIPSGGDVVEPKEKKN